jgi:hypothetical protein
VVSSFGELLERLVGLQFGIADADRCLRLGLRQGGADPLKPIVCSRRCAVSERAHKLVSAEADERVVWAHVFLDRICDIAQQNIARGMAVLIIDLLELVDVDVSEHKKSVSASSTDDFALDDHESNPTPECPGERVELGVPQLGSHVLMVATGGRSVRDGVLTVGSRMLAIGSSMTSVRGPLVSVDLRLFTISRMVVAVRRCMFAVGCGLSSVAIRGGVLAVIGGVVSVYRPLVAVGMDLVAVRCTSVPT